MNYGTIKNCDIANGIGVRVSLFVSGCRHHCKGCFQPETWSFDYGQPYTKETEDEIIEMLRPEYIDGLSLLGGEPFEPENQETLCPFLSKISNLYPEKTVWAYSGCTFDELITEGNPYHTKYTIKMLNAMDILVDGRFVEKDKDLMLPFRGSKNQRILDCKKSLTKNKPVFSIYNERQHF